MDKVRIAMIGVSGRGGIADHWRNSARAEVVAGADISEAALAQFQAASGGSAFVTTDYRRLLDRADIDAIAVTSPDFVHEEQAVAALEAGKHVFCEKPLAITTEGCDHILRTWKSSGKGLMVGFNMRYMRMFRTMKEIIDSGAIGEVRAVWVRHFVGHGSQFYYHDWHATRKNATSLLLQKGAHDIDVIHWLTGRYTRRTTAFGSLDYFGGDKPNDLTCTDCPEVRTCPEAMPDALPHMTHCAFRSEIDVEDNNMVLLELDGGVKAAYLQCHFAPDQHRNYTVIGTHGRLENSELEGKVWVKTRRSMTWRDYADRTYDIKPAEGSHSGADPIICEDFLDMILHGKEPLATPEAGRMSVAAGCAATESLRQGGIPQTVPPIRWE